VNGRKICYALFFVIRLPSAQKCRLFPFVYRQRIFIYSSYISITESTGVLILLWEERDLLLGSAKNFSHYIAYIYTISVYTLFLHVYTSDTPIGETDELACWLIPAHKSFCAAHSKANGTDESLAESLHVLLRYYGFHLFCLARNTIIWSAWLLDHVVRLFSCCRLQ
jgi:hypothetical protein